MRPPPAGNAGGGVRARRIFCGKGLTRAGCAIYSRRFATITPPGGPAISVEQTLQQLEQRITDLIKLTEDLSRENQTLRQDRRMLQQQFQSLQEKNQIAHGRVGQIVARLQSMQD